MSEVLSLLFSGMAFGLSIGIAPSPLLTLAISQTISYSTKEGMKIVQAPLITDIPLLIFTVFLYSRIRNTDFFLGIVSILGALFLAYMGYKNIKSRGFEFNKEIKEISKPDSIKKGIITNLLNPYPYIFWFTVSGPIVIKALSESIIKGFAFIIGFYLILLGSRMLIVALVGKSTLFIRGKGYQLVLKLLGCIMLIFAIGVFRKGIGFLF